jgi:hypothetical protein
MKRYFKSPEPEFLNRSTKIEILRRLNLAKEYLYTTTINILASTNWRNMPVYPLLICCGLSDRLSM